MLPTQVLPELPKIDAGAVSGASGPARKRIHSDADVAIWQKSTAHHTLTLFLARLCESAVGKGTQMWKRGTEENQEGPKTGVEGVLELLDELQCWTAEIEPLKAPQRFGNLAFRTWGSRLEERLTALHRKLMPSQLHPIIPELECYLLGGFGSWIRLDYGSGHELSFLAWLCFLARLGVFDHGGKSSCEEEIALKIVPKYLQVAWGLQDRYGLEPAGSHGVWGLDDYQFIPYAIGAAQLRNQTSYLPSAIAAANHKPEEPKMPIDEMLQFVPRHLSTAQSRTSSSAGQPPFANLYTTSIARIHALKRGPFSEHSPILYDVATTVPNWVKVQSGMLKMWAAECLDKRPVVQHFPFGQVAFVWEGSDSQLAEGEAAVEQVQPARAAIPAMAAPWANNSASMPATGAPWSGTNGSKMPSMLPTGAPWKSGTSGLPLPATSAPWTRTIPPSSTGNMASTGSAAAASSPFGIISKPSTPQRSRKE